MKIGILQCDRVREMHREQGFEDYPGMFERRFREVDPSLEFAVYRCLDGEFPASVDECDGYVSTGSKFSALDDEPWIRELERFLLRLVDARVPYVGICFGHQVLAKAMGGRVEQAAAGWGVGVSHNRLSGTYPWMDGDVLHDVNLVVSHQDQVVEAPEGMEVLGGSDFCPIYFCAVGDHVLSIQGHPEFSREYSRALMEMRRGVIADDVIAAGMASLDDRVDDREVFRWMLRFFEQGVAKRASNAAGGH